MLVIVLLKSIIIGVGMSLVGHHTLQGQHVRGLDFTSKSHISIATQIEVKHDITTSIQNHTKSTESFITL